MLAYLKGNITSVDEQAVIVITHDVGYEVFVHRRQLSLARVGETVEFWLDTVVGERDLRLFGFSRKDERDMFRLLNSVSGVGPKSALGILSVADPERIKEAVLNDEVELFTSVSGIGRKNASRIIIELKTRFSSSAKINPADLAAKHKDADDVISALSKLGYKKREIEPALGKVDASLSTEEKIKAVLKAL